MSPLARAQETLTYHDLIQRLIDLRQPAVLPWPGETCRQWSSWDRSSHFDPSTGKYVNWAANNDGPNFIRAEGDQVVMAEMEGPGCIDTETRLDIALQAPSHNFCTSYVVL